MVDLIGLGIVLGGAVLLFAGAALSIYGVALLGVVVGGGGGFLLAPSIGTALGLDGILATVTATAIGIVVGLVLSYLLLSLAIAAISFVAGTFAGLVVLQALFPGMSAIVLYPGAIVIGAVAAFLGSFASKTMIVLVSSFVGATLVSGSITLADVETAGAQFTLEPIVFDVWSPIFLGLFVVGLLVQFGIFKLGYVTRIVALLPGANVLRDRGRETKATDGNRQPRKDS